MMKKYNELLKSYQIKPISYSKKGNSLIVNTKNKKYVVKEKINNLDIYNYLENKSFKNFPKILALNESYELVEYIDDINEPVEEKFEELVKVVATLHNKTTYYEKIDIAYNKEIYENLKNNVEYLKSYYEDIIALIEMKEFMSPSEYLFARNYTIIINSLNYVDEAIDKWYESNKDNTSRRVVVLHNNLSLEHFISNKLISWRKSKIGSPIFDLLALFRNYGNKYNFEECLKLYETINPLKKEEINILYIFMIMPPKFEFKGSEYDMCEMLSEKIELIYSATKMILPDQFKDSKKDNQDKD